MGGNVRHVVVGLTVLLAVGKITPTTAAYTFEQGATFLGATTEWAPWASLFARHAQEQATIRACLAWESRARESRCKGAARSYAYLIRRARDIDARNQIRLVNRFINQRRYRDDRTRPMAPRNNFHTLFELYRRGGDCEDFAIAKYLVLRELGFSKDDLRVVITWERDARAYHAVLAVKVDDGVWLLETDDSIKRGRRQNRYRFLFSLNEDGVWDHEIHKHQTGRKTS